jgi:hypothetical protein
VSEPVQGDWPTAGTGVPLAFTALGGRVLSYLVLLPRTRPQAVGSHRAVPVESEQEADPTEAPSDPAEAVLEPGGVPHRCARPVGAGLGGHLRR